MPPNLVHEFLDPGGVTIGGDAVSYAVSGASVEVGGGVNLLTAGQDISYALYLDGNYQVPVDGDGATILQGTIGWKLTW